MPQKNVIDAGNLDPNHDIDLSGGKFSQTNAGELARAFQGFIDSGSGLDC